MKKIFFLIVFASIVSVSFSQAVTWKQPMIARLTKMADSLSQNLIPWTVPNYVLKVEDCGAIGDSITLNTKAIQKAIDSCSQIGGGVVLFSKGGYVTGTILLKSGVMLEVEDNAKILGSTNIADYPQSIKGYTMYRQTLIYAEKCNKVGIRGKGEIYFRGELVNFPGVETLGKIVNRPFGIKMGDCSNVVLQDIFLHNSAAWMQNYVACQNMIFDGIKVVNQANYNNDGLDPDGCTNVIIRNCNINSEDDAMCLKGASGKPSSNILIENSTFLSSCNALKTGTDTQGDFFNIVARNLKLGGIPNYMYALTRHDATSGITLATVDGGNVHDILISNVTIDSARCPIFMRIGSRLRSIPNTPAKGVGYLKEIVIENVSGKFNYKECSLILGLKGYPVSDVVIDNYKIKVEGGGTSSLIDKDVPKNDTGYPDARFFIPQGLPAYGFYVRYANNIAISNAGITPIKTDARPVIQVGDGTSEILFNGDSITPNSKLGINLMKLSGSSYNKMDSSAIVFGTLFNNTIGIEDVASKNNTRDNLYIIEGKDSLSIDRRKPATTSDILGIGLDQLSGTRYKLIINATLYKANDIAPYLADTYTKTSTALKGIETIDFTADAKVAATYQNRFSIVFKPTTLSVHNIVVTATSIGNVTTIKWNTEGEKGVSRFEVEKSIDGSSFTKIGEETAKNNTTDSYKVIDQDVDSPKTYYRIKAINTDGTITYSNLAVLTTHHSPLTTFYPNPLVGKTLELSFINLAAGKYTVNINNMLGQKVQEVAISHAGGNAKHAITVNNTMLAGTHIVTIMNASGYKIYQSKLSFQP